jgi:DNA-binding CsgD family transcriptional regulator/predicted enzyme related to lactoylglutathione lyase
MRQRPRGRPRHPDLLTPAEWRVADFVRHGLSNRAIARHFGVSLDAVKFHLANIGGKLQLSGRDALRRWHGAPSDSALAHSRSRKESSMSSTLELGPIGQISRTVKNIDHAVTWYGEVLGLPHLYTFGKLAFFDCGGTRLFLSQSDAPTPESTLYLRVDDIDAGYLELTRRGVKFQGAPHMIHRHGDGTEEWMAFFEDPEGRSLALMSQVKQLSQVKPPSGA